MVSSGGGGGLTRSNSAESGLGMFQRTVQQADDLVSVTVRKNDPNQKAGISLVERLGQVYITKVTENGLFFNTEVEIGDLVLSINGKRLGKGEGAREIIKHIGSAKSKVTMVVKKSSRKAHRGVRSLSPTARRKKKKGGKMIKETVTRNADGSLRLHVDPRVENLNKERQQFEDYEQFSVRGKKLYPNQDAGVMLMGKDNKIFVSGIALDSIFFDSELELGDRVVSVNEMNFINYGDAMYAKKLIQKSKAEITLVIEKGHTNFDPKIDRDKGHNVLLMKPPPTKHTGSNKSGSPRIAPKIAKSNSKSKIPANSNSSSKRGSSYNKSDSENSASRRGSSTFRGSDTENSTSKRGSSYIRETNSDDNKSASRRGSSYSRDTSDENKSSSKRGASYLRDSDNENKSASRRGSSYLRDSDNDNKSSSKRGSSYLRDSENENKSSSKRGSSLYNIKGDDSDISISSSEGTNNNNRTEEGFGPPQRVLSKAAIEDGKRKNANNAALRVGKPIKLTRSSSTGSANKQATPKIAPKSVISNKSTIQQQQKPPPPPSDDMSEESPLVDKYTTKKPAKSAVSLLQNSRVNKKKKNTINRDHGSMDSASESSMDEDLEPLRSSSWHQGKPSQSSNSSIQQTLSKSDRVSGGKGSHSSSSIQLQSSLQSSQHSSSNGSLKWDEYDGDYMKVTVRKKSMDESGISLMKTEGKFILTQVPDHETRISPGMQVLAINGVANLHTIIKADDLIKRSSVVVVLYIAFNEPVENTWNCPCCGKAMNAEGCHVQPSSQQPSPSPQKIPPSPPGPIRTSTKSFSSNSTSNPSSGNSSNPPDSVRSLSTYGSSVVESVSDSVTTARVNNHAPPGQRLSNPKLQRPRGSHHLNNLYNFDDFDSDSETEDNKKPPQQQTTPTTMTRRKPSRSPSPSQSPQTNGRPLISRYAPNDRFMVRVTIKSKDDGEPNPSGIEFFHYKGSIYVVGVSEDGPFYPTAINKGDKVLSINRRKASLIKNAADALSIVEEKQAANIFALRPDPEDEEYKEALKNFPA